LDPGLRPSGNCLPELQGLTDYHLPGSIGALANLSTGKAPNEVKIYSYNIPGKMSSLEACGLVDKSLKILGGPTL